jgi:hypothetical protein
MMPLKYEQAAIIRIILPSALPHSVREQGSQGLHYLQVRT